MILLFTDFGANDLYVGQMKSRILSISPAALLVDLYHENSPFDIAGAAHLLAALDGQSPSKSVTVAVVDPGVGSSRAALALSAGDKWFIGPDNGILSIVAQRCAGRSQYYELIWRPEQLSVTFHGRDLFGPFAAMLDSQHNVDGMLQPVADVVSLPAGDLFRCIHVDRYGNIMTGIRAETSDRSRALLANGRSIAYASAFFEAPAGQAFWYCNSFDLIEIAVNQGNAAKQLGMSPGMPVEWMV